ncbi:MAG TPA: cell division ATP-binding protein FtsE [Patescibacteria group bacterium]|nr:cell division ATP-binding protein FtsE [bacterium]HRY56559.1 cell division ATP-binding protein FtsE [Patescibacteria group bacterium]
MSQIEFKNVTKEYIPGNKVLDDVSFSIEKGEFIFIIGPSGAGKSTIIKLLTREEKPEEGQVVFNNQDISNIKPEEMPEFRRKIGVVYQDYKLLNSKTVYDNVAVSLEVVDADEQEIKSVVPNVLSLVGLLDHSSYYPQELSGGEKQRVAIARALAHEPDVLIADEATGMIDPDVSDEIVELLEKINSLGTTVIMATHDQRIVDKLTKRVIKIQKGKLVSDKKGGKYRA